MEINYLFELLFKNQYDGFIRYYKKYETEINDNPLLPNPLKILMKELEDDFANKKPQKRTTEWVGALYGAHSGKILHLSNDLFERLIVCLIKIHEDSDLDYCKKLSKIFPNNPFCKQFLDIDKHKDSAEEYSNIIRFEPKFKKNEPLDDEKKAITLKKKMKIDILDKLASQRKRTTIAMLYDMTKIMNTYYNEELFYECLKSLKKNKKVIFADISDIYSEVRLQNKF